MERRHRLMLVAACVVLVGAVLAPVGMKVKKAAAQDPTFCTNCHLMDGAWERWSESAHAGITCVKCHPGNLQTDLRHGFFALIGRTEVRGDAGVDQHACEGCHLEGKDPKWPKIAATAGHEVHSDKEHLTCVGCHASTEHVSRPASEVCHDCHEQAVVIGKMTEVHCLDCHNFLAQGSNLEPSAETCRGCHREGGKAPVVAAHGTQDCLGCHQPHEAATAHPEACASCHEEDNGHHAEGQAHCADCHEPHHVGREARDACGTCHEGKHHGGHAGCVECHHGHGGVGEPEHCATCHVKLPGLHTQRRHGDCGACHDAHTLADVGADRCLTCHAADHASVGCSGCHAFHD